MDIHEKRKNVKNAPSKIVGIYDRFLYVTSVINGYEESFTISYIDILTNKNKIIELENMSEM